MHVVGFRHLLCNEFAKRACETLTANGAVVRPADWSNHSELPTALNSPWPLIPGDIRSIPSFSWLEGKVDVVAGGPPCQPFSLGGVHKGHEDERNMFPELFRVVRETRPKAIICENVQGLLRPSFKPYFDYILRELSSPFQLRKDSEDWQEHNRRLPDLAGEGGDPADRYDVYPIVVNAADYGVPQIRRRIIIVAFRRDLAVKWTPPKQTHFESLLLRDQAEGVYWERHGIEPKVEATVPTQLPEGEGLLPWVTLRDAISDLPAPIIGKGRKGYAYHIGWPGARIYKGHTPNVLDRPAKTVKAGVHGVPGGESVLLLDNGKHRYMTVREVARVMTFPDEWKLAGPRGEQMRQLGNAVPVRLGEVFARAVADALAEAKVASRTTAA